MTSPFGEVIPTSPEYRSDIYNQAVASLVRATIHNNIKLTDAELSVVASQMVGSDSLPSDQSIDQLSQSYLVASGHLKLASSSQNSGGQQ